MQLWKTEEKVPSVASVNLTTFPFLNFAVLHTWSFFFFFLLFKVFSVQEITVVKNPKQFLSIIYFIQCKPFYELLFQTETDVHDLVLNHFTSLDSLKEF